MSDKEVKQSTNGKYSFKSIFRIFLKTGKRRLIITIITGFALFLVLSTFFMSWFSYRYTSFFNYQEEYCNWRHDSTVSVYITNDVDYPTVFSYGYLEQKTNDAIAFLNSVVQNAYTNYTAGLSLILFYYNETSGEISENRIICLEDKSYEIITDNLLAGNIPTNRTELIYFKQSVNQTYDINDIVRLSPKTNGIEQNRNFTIVGTVENVQGQLYANGYSFDIVNVLKSAQEYFYYGYTYTYETFITSNYYFTSIVRNFTEISGFVGMALDFNYQITANHVRNIPQILGKFRDAYYYHYDNFCNDLSSALWSFNAKWLFETIRIFICSLPILVIFGLVCIETFKIGTHELESKFRLMKIQGMEYKSVKRIILLENFIFSTSSLLVGTITGFLVSYFIFRGFGNEYFKDYFFSILEPVILITLILLFLFFFLGGYLLENSLAKRTAKLTTTRYRSKRRERFRRFIRTPEVAMFLIGLGLAAVGFLGLILIFQFSIFDENFNSDKYLLAFSYLIGIGALLVLISIFLFLSRLVMLLWQFIGQKIWFKTKSYLTLSLKHLSIYNKNYHRAILLIFIFCLGLIPGILLNKSTNIHNHVEAKLETGYCDLAIDTWSPSLDHLKENITNISGIEKIEEIDIYGYSVKIDPYDYYSERIRINAIVINNISNFLDIVEDELYTITSYAKEDINNLQGNMTCFVDTKHAKELHLNNGSTFRPEFIRIMEESLETIYIHNFDYFPMNEKIPGVLYSWYNRANYIYCQETWDILKNYTVSGTDFYSHTANLLIKTTPDANITYIKEQLSLGYGLYAISFDEFEEDLNNQVNHFGLNYFKIATILAIIASMFFGYITARNIYHQRLRIIESQYQIGAKRNQIWFSYTIELIVTIFIPLIIGLGVTQPILKYSTPFMMNLQTNYYNFHPWFPWWLFIIIFIMGYVIFISGWLLEIIPLVKKYRPIKQE